MQLRNMTLLIAVLGLSLTACPGGGRESLACDTDASCTEENEICHPQAKVCVKTCALGADCPDSAKTCEAISNSDARKVCKCSTDTLCQGDTTVTDASTLKCDTTYKVCTSGTTSATCAKDADCGSGQVCDTATKQCKAGTPEGTACTGEGKTTCSYGQFCSSNVCKAVAAPTCANFDPAQGGRPPTFNASTSTGPIIFSVTQTSFGQDSFCAGTTVKALVKAYTTGTPFTKKSDLAGLFYVRVNGTQTDGTALILDSQFRSVNNGSGAEFTMNFCPTANATQLTIGLYFSNGNETCAVFSR